MALLRQLDLGAGGANRIEEGYEGYGVDIFAKERPWLVENKSADLALQPIPFKDNMFDLVTAHDVLEHIPKVLYTPITDHVDARTIEHGDIRFRYQHSLKKINCMIELFNEVYRVLKDGGQFYFVVPKGGTNQYMADPTHVSEWCEDSVNYYSGDYFGMHDDYGHTSKFERLSVDFHPDHDWRLQVRLKAVKPAKEPYNV